MEESEADWDGAERVGDEMDVFPGLAQAGEEEDLFGRAPQFDFDIWEGPRAATSASPEENEEEDDLVWRGCAVAVDPSEDQRYSRAPRVLARPFPAAQQSPPDFASVLSPEHWRGGAMCGDGNESGPEESSNGTPPQHDDIDCASAPLLPKSYPLEVSTFVVKQPVRVVARLIADWLERRTADYDFDPATCSFSVVCVSDYTKITFNVYFFSRAGADGRAADDRVLVEFQRRSGDGLSFTRIFHAIRSMLRAESAKLVARDAAGRGAADLPPPPAASSGIAGIPPAPQISETATSLPQRASVPPAAGVDIASVAVAVAGASGPGMSSATPSATAAAVTSAAPFVMPQSPTAVAAAPKGLEAPHPPAASLPQAALEGATTPGAAPASDLRLPEDSNHARVALRPVRQMLLSEFADVQREGCRLVARLAEVESNTPALCEGPMLRAVLDATDASDPCVSRCAASAAANLATHVFRDKPWAGGFEDEDEGEDEDEDEDEEGKAVGLYTEEWPGRGREARDYAAARSALGQQCTHAEARVQNPKTSRQFRRECARFLLAATHDARYRKIIRSTGRVSRQPRQLGAITPRPAISAIVTPVPAQPAP